MTPPDHKDNHPIRAMLLDGKHPFPPDIETMLRRLLHKPGALTTEIAMDAFDWERGERLEVGRKKLAALCKHHGV
jgi:hypothetical protein